MTTNCRNLFTAAAAASALAVGGLAHSAELTTSENSLRPRATHSVMAGFPCGNEMITQNLDPTTLVFPNVPVCNDEVLGTSENWIARTWPAGQLNSICGVRFAIGALEGAQQPTSIDVVVKQGAALGSAPGSMPVLGSVTVDIPGGTQSNLQFFDAVFPNTINPNPAQPVTIALRIDAEESGTSIFPGGNPNGETAPTYIASEECGMTTYTTMTSIAFPDAMVVMMVFTGSGGACPADINGDGVIDITDMMAVLSNWGNNPGPADVNGDGVVDIVDMLAVLGAWGQCTASPAATGACCFDDGSCVADQTEDDCAAIQGNYNGDFSTCISCPQPPDGAECSSALPITIDGPGVVVDTTGNPTPSLPLCDSITPAQPTAWLAVTPETDQLLTVHACTDIQEARVAVYCGDCEQELAPMVCLAGGAQNNDMSLCGNPFDGQATFCAGEGNTYYIAVWRQSGGPGEVEVHVSSGGSCTSTVVCQEIFAPICDLGNPNCQGGPTGGTWASSDIVLNDAQNPPAGGVMRADDFHAASTGNITSVCWQGTELKIVPSTSACDNLNGQGFPFAITYYHDAGGKPGAVKAGPFVGTPDFVRIGTIDFGFPGGQIEYTMDHPAVPVVAGECLWIEIVGQTPSGNCAFFWKPSPEGNGVLYSRTGNDQYGDEPSQGLTNPDRHFCVNITLGDPDTCLGIGACCVDGVCSQESGADCAAMGGCFTPGASCAEANCVSADYHYDCGETDNALGWGDGGVFGWMHRFDVDGGGTDTITQILTGYGFTESASIGVTPGQLVGVGVFEDTGNGPGALIFTTTTTAAASAIGTDQPQVINITPTQVNGSFYIAVWTEHAMDTFPSPMVGKATNNIGDAWFFGTIGGSMATFDPENPGTPPTDLNGAGFPGGWLLRANSQ